MRAGSAHPRAARARSRALAVTLLSLAGFLFGCPAKLPAGATALDKIRIEGNKEVDSDKIEDAIASSETSKVLGLVHLWWVDYSLYDPTTLEKDLERIERFYKARGFYEARVRAGRVIHTGEREVRVQIVVEEGSVVKLARVQVSGLEDLPADVRRRVSAAWKLAPGDHFDEDLYHQSGASLERALTDEGYAYATLKQAADVDLIKHEAVVHLEVLHGPHCTFGDVQIAGLDELSVAAVRKVLAIKPGDDYSTRTMRDAQNALFDLGTFDTVNFEPDLSDPKRTAVPLVVHTTETKLRSVKAGPGLLVDPLRNDVHFTAGWEDRNFIGGLRRFRVNVRPMLILRPGFFSVREVRPGIVADAELRQPSFVEARTNGVIGATGGMLPDPVNEYRVVTAEGSVGFDRRFWSILYAGLFYRKALQDPYPYSGFELPPNAFASQLGFFELLGSLDARDDILKPTKGFFVSLSAQYALAANRALFGDFHDLRLLPDVRMYGPISKGIVLAVRFTTGFLFPLNYQTHNPDTRTPTPDDPSHYQMQYRSRDERFDATGTPPAWRAFYSGGATDNRGYPTREVGLRDCNADIVNGQYVQKEFGQDCSVAVGGASMWSASVELRFDIAGPLGAVLFVDASDTSRNIFDIRLDYPHLSAGPGLRYITPVGPVRLDFGWRLPGLQRIGGDLDPREVPRDFNLLIKGPFALHFSLGEAF